MGVPKPPSVGNAEHLIQKGSGVNLRFKTDKQTLDIFLIAIFFQIV